MNFIKKHNEFKYYLLEKSIEVGDSLIHKLDKIKSPLSKKVKDFLKSNDISDKADIIEIDFDENDNKVFTIIDEKGGKRKLKFGKLLKYLGYDDFDKIKGYEIEDFILNFKKTDEFSNLKLRKGDDILKSYLCDNYDSKSYGYGGLSSSCMRFERSQKYLKIYTQNPDKVSCLTLFNPDNNKIRGRALIWKLDNGDYYMDRIYTSNDYKNVFLKYADKNNIDTYGDNPNDRITLTNKGEYDYYPYMDTFDYYTPDSGVLSHSDGEISLKSTDGSHSGDMVWSELYGEEIDRSESVYSEYLEDYIYRHDSVEVYTKVTGNPDNDETSYVSNNHYDENYIKIDYASDKYDNYIGEDVINHLSLKLENEDKYVLIDDESIYDDGLWGVYLKEESFDDWKDFDQYIFSKKVTYKEDDNYENYVPYDDIISIWNKDQQEIVIATKDDTIHPYDSEVYDDYDDTEDYVNLTLYSYSEVKEFTENLYLPKSFMGNEDKMVTSSMILSEKSPIYFNIKGDIKMKSDDTVNIHDGIYLTKKEIESTIKTPSGPKVFPPLSKGYMAIKYQSFKNFKNYFIENKIKPKGLEAKFLKSFNRGSILENQLMKVLDSKIEVFDTFKSMAKKTNDEIKELIDYISDNLDYSGLEFSSSLTSLFGFYDHIGDDENMRIFPFLNKGDKYLTKRQGKYFLYTANQIINFIQYNAFNDFT